MTGFLHPCGHVKKRLPRLLARRLKDTIYTDTVFCSRISSVNGRTYFQ